MLIQNKPHCIEMENGLRRQAKHQRSTRIFQNDSLNEVHVSLGNLVTQLQNRLSTEYSLIPRPVRAIWVVLVEIARQKSTFFCEDKGICQMYESSTSLLNICGRF